MPLVLADRVNETTTTTSTGTITLAGAVSGYQSFAVIGNGNTTYYTIVHQTANEWEVGIGTYTSSGTTLSRDTVLASSNSGSLVNFSAGTKFVFCDYPAGRAVYLDTATNVTIPGLTLSNGTANGVLYLNGSKVATSGSALAFDGTNFSIGAPWTTNPLRNSQPAFYQYSSGTTLATFVGETGASLGIFRVQNAAASGQLQLGKSRGTWASPLAVQSGDPMGDLAFVGFGGTNSRILGRIVCSVDTYTSDTDISSFLDFRTSSSGSASATEKMRLTAAGNLGIGTTSPLNRLAVVGSDPVLYLVNSKTAANNNVARLTLNPSSAFDNSGYYNLGPSIDGLLESTSTNASALVFSTYNGSSLVERMRLTAAGDLGLGTASPANYANYRNLAISGTTGANIDMLSGSTKVGNLFNDATNFYAYNVIAGSLVFGTNNTERMRLDSAGRFLLGASSNTSRGGSNTTALFYKASGTQYLDIQTGTSGDSGLLFSATSSSAYGLINYSNSVNAMLFYANSAEVFRITSSGLLGLGTTSPAAKLHVVNSTPNSGRPTALFDANYGNAGDTVTGLRLNVNTGAGGGYQWGYSTEFVLAHNMEFISGSNYVARATTASYLQQIGGEFVFFSNQSLTAGNTFTPTERMRLNSSGNLGIGTASPGARLDIVGDATPNGTGLAFGHANTAGYKWIQSFASQPLYINPLGNNTIFNRDSGNVGIGTASPVYRLDVQHTTNGIGMRLRNTSTGVELATRTDATTSGIDAGNAPNGMTFSLNTVEGMRLTSTGLGIGRTNPQCRVDAERNSYGITAAFRSYDGTNNPRLIIYGTSSGTVLQNTFSTTAANLMFAIGGAEGAGTEVARFDSSGNFGLGVTPSAWGSVWKAQQLQVGAFVASQTNASDIIHIGTNAFANSSNLWTYINTAAATRYQQYQGAHSWFTAPSGTAGNTISFTQAMTLDASGNLALGRTSVATIGSGYRTVDLDDVSGSGIRFRSNGTSIGFIYCAGTSFLDLGTSGAYPLTFTTNGAERARITSGGDVGIGTTSPGVKLDVVGAIRSSTTTSGSTVSATTDFRLNNATFSRIAIGDGGGGWVGGYSITYSGSVVHSDTGAISGVYYTNGGNIQFYAGPSASAGTAAPERARITSGGDLLIGKTGANLAAVGVELRGGNADSYFVVNNASSVLALNRETADGDLIRFFQGSTALEGTISVSGATVSYNAFAGSHWSQLQDGSRPDILRGTVMESINELCEWPGEDNERLPKAKISDTAGSKKVYGVFMTWEPNWDTTNDMLITSVGAFICRVNGSVTVQEGDLLESNGDGTARVQADDIIRSSTIGKVTSTVKTHQYDDGSYCVPTVLYCG